MKENFLRSLVSETSVHLSSTSRYTILNALDPLRWIDVYGGGRKVLSDLVSPNRSFFGVRQFDVYTSRRESGLIFPRGRGHWRLEGYSTVIDR